jgi:tetratricopeptide (TPR) repeat protein
MRRAALYLLCIVTGFAGCAIHKAPQRGILEQYDRYVALQSLKQILRSSTEPDLSELQLAAELSPNDAEVLELWARYLEGVGQSDEAEKLLSKATRLDPSYAGAWFALGQIYGAQGRLDAALQACEIAKSLNPLEIRFRQCVIDLQARSGGDFSSEQQKATIVRRLPRGF